LRLLGIRYIHRRRALTEAVVALAPASGLTAAPAPRSGFPRQCATKARPADRVAGDRPSAAEANLPRASRNSKRCSTCYMRRVSPTGPVEITPPCSMKAPITVDPHHVSPARSERRSPERRQQLRHPVYQKPELAEKPNEVWSWDITKLMGPTKWSYFYLYVIPTSLAAAWSAGAWRMLKAPRCSGHCSMMRSRNTTCHPVTAACRSRRSDEGEGHGFSARRSRGDLFA
jgi:hypothetical protein